MDVSDSSRDFGGPLTRFFLPISIALIALYTIYGAIYRLYLTPIAHIPGPLIARLTFWNEFYYDVFLGGKYTFKLKEYHDKYGPVIRINPYEVHILDSDFYEQLYLQGNKRVDKWDWAMRMFGQYDNSSFDTLDHHKHRMRRAPWTSYFSKAAVIKVQPLLIQSCVNKLCDRFAEYQAANRAAKMIDAFSCLTADVISEYSYPEGYGFLDRRPNYTFDGAHYESWMALSRTSHALKQFGWLFPLLDSLPLWLVKYTSKETYSVLLEQENLRRQARNTAAQLDPENPKDYKETTGRPSMLETFMLSDTLPESEKKMERIRGEATIAMGAGTLTSSHALKTATYHILANPAILNRLMKELEAAIPDVVKEPPTLRTLESIDYLMAILYETLRIFYGVPHRLQRIHPDRPIVYKSKDGSDEVIIPPGTPVGMSCFHIHNDEVLFPDHNKFDPERWLPLNTNGVRLQRYIAAFGKGSRQCVGMELGKAEILTTIACVFLRFGRSMRLVDVVRERDIDISHDWFNPAASADNNGLLVAFDADRK